MSILSVDGLFKSFNGVQALRGLDLTIDSGIFGLIGPNGAGKTTLIRILLGLIRPDSGNAQVIGLDIRKESREIRQHIGILHERASYPEHMTPMQYLSHVIRLYNSDKNPQDLLTMVNLTDIGSRKIRELSAGMKQRLGIAQAMVGSPQLIFLDEPTSNLDVTSRDEVINIIMQLHTDQGISFFIASHILSELERVCHNVGFIHLGRVVEQGTILDVLSKYTSNMLKIITPEPEEVLQQIQLIPGVLKVRIAGSNQVIVVVAPAEKHETQRLVQKTLESLSVSVQGILDGAGSLEDAYREIMRGE